MLLEFGLKILMQRQFSREATEFNFGAPQPYLWYVLRNDVEEAGSSFQHKVNWTESTRRMGISFQKLWAWLWVSTVACDGTDQSYSFGCCWTSLP